MSGWNQTVSKRPVLLTSVGRPLLFSLDGLGSAANLRLRSANSGAFLSCGGATLYSANDYREIFDVDIEGFTQLVEHRFDVGSFQLFGIG